MTLEALRKAIRARYGLEYSDTEDAYFTNALLTELVNEAHRWLAREARCYTAERTANLVAGTAVVLLDADVYRLDTGSVRLLSGGCWRALEATDPDWLQRHNGPVDNAESGTPWCFYLRQGASGRELMLYPPPAETTNDALKYVAYVYPAALSADGDLLPLADGEAEKLVPVVCWKMAEAELSRGRSDAPVGYWDREARRAAAELVEIAREGRRGAVRRVRSGVFGS